MQLVNDHRVQNFDACCALGCRRSSFGAVLHRVDALNGSVNLVSNEVVRVLGDGSLGIAQAIPALRRVACYVVTKVELSLEFSSDTCTHGLAPKPSVRETLHDVVHGCRGEKVVPQYLQLYQTIQLTR